MRGRTASFSYERAEFRAKKNIDVVEDELHHHRLDPNLHEGGRAAEAGGFNLFRPERIAGRSDKGRREKVDLVEMPMHLIMSSVFSFHHLQ